MSEPSPRRLFRPSHLAILLGLGLVAAIPESRRALLTAGLLLASGQLGQFQRHLQSLGAWGPVVSIALLVAEALIVPLPATIILVANGLVFGLWLGSVVSLAGGLIGGATAYAIGHHYGRALLERLLSADRLAQTDRVMAKYGAWAIVIERWIPGIPGDPMSYAAGVTRMPPLKYLALTTIGLVPSNLVAAYVGVEIAGDVPIAYWIAGWGAAGAVWLGWRWRKRRAAR